MTAPQCLKVSEAGDRLGVSRWTIQRLVADGALQSVRVGRTVLIVEDDLARFIAAGGTRAAS